MKNQSTGPRSAEGKAVSSRNALKSGIYARSEVVLPHENPDDLQTLTTEYYDRFAPADPEQRCLVDALISDEWLLRRFRTIEAQLLARDMRRAYEPDKKSPLGQAYERGAATLERLQRRVNTTRRNYNRSLELLNKLQAAPSRRLLSRCLLKPLSRSDSSFRQPRSNPQFQPRRLPPWPPFWNLWPACLPNDSALH